MALIHALDYMALLTILLCVMDALRTLDGKAEPVRAFGLVVTAIGTFTLIVCGYRWPWPAALFHSGAAVMAVSYLIARHRQAMR